jgi:HK97 family phage major capsid protein
MNHTITKKRPYSFNALLSSLSSQVPDKQATWEQNLSLQAEKFYGQHSIQKKQENAAFIPTQRMLRDLITGTASSGGDLVATSVQTVADSVRPVTVLERAGVERIETGGENLTIPRFAEADAGWIAEGADYTALTTTSTSVDASPKLASARLSFSRRLKVLVPDVEGSVLQEVGRAVAGLIEKGAIQGTGSNSQPLGLLNLPDALSQTFTAATPTSDELASMLEKLGDADVDLSKVVFLMHPSTAADLMRTEISSGSGQLVLSDLKIHGLPVFISSNVTEDKVIAMDPSYSRIVYFNSAQVVVDPFRGAISGVTHVQVLNAMDFVCTHQSSICIGSA